MRRRLHPRERRNPNFFGEEPAIKKRKGFSAPPEIAAAVPVEDRAAALKLIREEIGDCTRCALHSGRHSIVFADGSPTARLMFVGEGPGADEDAQGLPFVGRAGQLLNNMIAAMGLKREEVYIANIVKCRPPGNRTPEPDEANTCSPVSFPPDRRSAASGSGRAGSHSGHLSAWRAPAAGRIARARARLSRHEPHRHLSPGVSAPRSAPEKRSLGRFADCDEGAGAEGAGEELACNY